MNIQAQFQQTALQFSSPSQMPVLATKPLSRDCSQSRLMASTSRCCSSARRIAGWRTGTSPPCSTPMPLSSKDSKEGVATVPPYSKRSSQSDAMPLFRFGSMLTRIIAYWWVLVTGTAFLHPQSSTYANFPNDFDGIG